jgi:hypothetical protein
MEYEMANKLSKAAVKAAKYLSENPTVTATELARKYGLSESAVRGSAYWKGRPGAKKVSAKKVEESK